MFKVLISFLLISNVFAVETAGSLGEALSSRGKTFSQKMPKEVVELYQNNIKDMQKAGISKKALKVGDKAPDVVINFNGKKIPLKDLYSAAPVVLKFYRGGWCPYCMTELKYYEGKNADFKKAGSQIIAISPDTLEATTKTKSTNGLSYDVVSDENHEIARKFNLVYKLDQKVFQSTRATLTVSSLYLRPTSSEKMGVLSSHSSTSTTQNERSQTRFFKL
jgi:peroxiredoxin